MLREPFLAGVDTFRMNFSHGVQRDHAKVHAAIRSLKAEFNRPIGILQDLQGPKTRVGAIANGKLEVTVGESVRFAITGSDGDKDTISLPHQEIFGAIAPGQDLLIGDGLVRVKIIA